MRYCAILRCFSNSANFVYCCFLIAMETDVPKKPAKRAAAQKKTLITVSELSDSEDEEFGSSQGREKV